MHDKALLTVQDDSGTPQLSTIDFKTAEVSFTGVRQLVRRQEYLRVANQRMADHDYDTPVYVDPIIRAAEQQRAQVLSVSWRSTTSLAT